MNVTELDQRLRSGKTDHIYLFHGPEGYLRQGAIERIVAALAVDGQAPVKPTRLDAGQVNAAAAMDAARSLNLFAERQALVVGDISAWEKGSDEALGSYLSTPNAATTLLLWAEKLDQRGRLYRAISANVPIIDCKQLYANQLPDWVRMECKRQGREIAREAARLLVDAVGTELGSIAQEIAKLCCYTEGRLLVTVADVEAIVLATSQRSIFALCDAVGHGDRLEALRTLEALLTHGEPPVRVMAMLARHWRLLSRAQEWLANGRPGELAAVLKVAPYFAKGYAEQAARCSPEGLRRGFDVLSGTDRALKRSRVPGRTILTRTIMQLIG
ncbi:MAG: DNA polymerase III subunit delta [Deltaproteobacteria bacterium]|nr:DNA polymerase III subunit delta [Deltaproteobacteria bacterium]